MVAGIEMNAKLPFGRAAAKTMLDPLVSWCRGGTRQASGRATSRPEPAAITPRSNRGNAILRADPAAGDKSGGTAYDT